MPHLLQRNERKGKRKKIEVWWLQPFVLQMQGYGLTLVLKWREGKEGDVGVVSRQVCQYGNATPQGSPAAVLSRGLFAPGQYVLLHSQTGRKAGSSWSRCDLWCVSQCHSLGHLCLYWPPVRRGFRRARVVVAHLSHLHWPSFTVV